MGYLEIIFGVIIALIGVVVIAFMVERSRKQQARERQNRIKRHKSQKKEKPILSPKAEPTSSNIKKIPSLRADDIPSKVEVFDLKLIEDKVLYFLSKVECDGVEYKRIKGLGVGWCRLNNRKSGLGAIWWIYENFDPDEFEKFSCAILAHHKVADVRVSEKRKSGADGGIDGLGRYQIEEASVDVAIQAKKYRPNRYVDTSHLNNFVGALITHDIDYGFLITTGIISDRARQDAKQTTDKARNNINLQLLDQHDLIKCMEYRADSAHGYGLHKTDDNGWYYLNPTILKKAISKY